MAKTSKTMRTKMTTPRTTLFRKILINILSTNCFPFFKLSSIPLNYPKKINHLYHKKKR